MVLFLSIPYANPAAPYVSLALIFKTIALHALPNIIHTQTDKLKFKGVMKTAHKIYLLIRKIKLVSYHVQMQPIVIHKPKYVRIALIYVRSVHQQQCVRHVKKRYQYIKESVMRSVHRKHLYLLISHAPLVILFNAINVNNKNVNNAMMDTYLQVQAPYV